MNNFLFEQLLRGVLHQDTPVGDVLETALGDPQGASEITEVRSFADAGLMTVNDGLVVSFADGTEFQLQIVQSK